ncbi:7031_t:CDS:10 [Acaulospora colombiana]|uniref:7031_t:CDS:1 n=1 Tax=Acaulospora colombiana TaxID=27376 RepID=A0ACA9LJ37_9GLOM|nr:7031_t:CDS:10 [Acaulospora colombiana]
MIYLDSSANYLDRRSKRRRSISPDSRRPPPADGGDHYIPNYDKEGYTPGPRYNGKPGDTRYPPHGFPVGLHMGFSVPAPPLMTPGGPLMPMDWTTQGRQEALKDPDQLDFLVTFKYFAEFLQSSQPKVRFTDDDLHKRYNDYKEAFGVKQLKTFFDAHKKEEWFLEKYHPKHMGPRIEATKILKRKGYNQFLEDLKEGLFDNIINDVVEESKDDMKVEDSNTEKNDPDEDANRLFIKSVSPKISGFKYLALSEPNPQKKFHRLGWIVFEEGTDMDKAYEKLNEQKTGPVRNRTTPDIANQIDRLKKDLSFAIKLIEKLDNDVDDSFNGVQTIKQRLVLISNDEQDETTTVKRALDIHIEYLRRVHLFCYYCGSESDSVEELNRKCPGRHLRSVTGTSDAKSAGKSQKEKQINASAWIKTLDNKISYKTDPQKFENEIEKHGGLNVKAVMETFYSENVIEVEAGRKFKCNICGKLFKGSEFVKKHIDYKHHDMAKFYNNYVLDPNHLLPTTPPNPTAALSGPSTVSTLPPNPFPVIANAPPPPFMNFGFPIVGAAAGTPHDQIPRIGFDDRDDRDQRNSRSAGDRRRQASSSRPNDFNASSDPRQVKSYVDLDAPAEGDIEIKY